ncbi:putative integral membrane protein [Babesia bovis T2Bo]|uniref:putative integral membrane protein n=1 Tax=Babesia bovis T2Bo TaxID=484906 RepID=UPI001C3697FE|nr:putative integral membrane protein [Babesia bovis T2Bo]KAG6440009.1 putative integral membrane protein [Babesia bovis T2Bo]
MLGSIVDYAKNFTGLIALLSLILTRYIDFTTFSPLILRPLLNLAWAFIFGTHLWYLFFAGEDIFLPDREEGFYFAKKREVPFTEISEECNKFLTLTLLCNAIIVVTTRGLAPFYFSVQYCSVVSLLSTFINVFFVPKVTEAYTQGFPFSHVAPSTCSRLLACLTCGPLVIYMLL